VINGRRAKIILCKVLRIAGWLSVSLLFLLILSIIPIRIPHAQNKLTEHAISFFERRIGTEVSLTRICIQFPRKVVLEGLILEDQSSDTLIFFAKSISIDT
jgi:hypothetical protein